MSFDRISSQPEAVSLLKGMIASRKLPHALLIQGVEGETLRSMAVELARALMCEASAAEGGCGVCPVCAQIESGTHPDYTEIGLLDDAREIKIAQILEMISRASLRPFKAQCKVYVVKDAEAMNEEAQSAFLKTLEEPEPETYFVLLAAEPERLLATIRSRVQCIALAPGLVALEDPELERVKNQLVAFCLGQTTTKPDISGYTRREILRFIDYMIQTFRDIMVLKAGAGRILNAASVTGLKDECASKWEWDYIEGRIERLAEFKRYFDEQVNVKLGLSVLWDALTKK